MCGGSAGGPVPPEAGGKGTGGREGRPLHWTKVGGSTFGFRGAAEPRRIKPAAPRAQGACGAGDFYFFAMPASLV